MAYVIQLKDPFNPNDVEKHSVEPGITIREWLKLHFGPEFVEFEMPTICMVNGQPLMRNEWDRIIRERDIVIFAPVTGYMWIIVALVVLVIAMAVMASTAATPQVPGEAPASDPVFSTKGQQNQIRLGEPVEVNYGRNRIYPSLASRPYFQYVDNDQYQFALFCIGQGEYEISALQIGDTPLTSYQEVEYEIIPPGSQVTLFPTNVITSIEAGGQTLFAPNEEEYVDPGWVGPFAANPADTESGRIELDFIFPKGLYYLNTNGGMDEVLITIEIEYQTIDNLGVPTDAWTNLATETITGTTTTPQRQTFTYDVPLARYQIRVRRTDSKIVHYRAGHDVVWEGLRGFVDVEQDFGNKTLWAVKIRATNNLNDRTQLLFNCIATRKLQILDEEGELTEDLHATRGIVPAFLDCFRSLYGGRIPDNFFDWDALAELDALYEERGDHFDWIFRDPITVWEAAAAIARVGRAIPLLVGSLITMKRDTPMDIPVTIFTPDNMVAGTFQIDVMMWALDENDSLRIEYTEPATGYKQETVLCTLPGGTTNNPKDVRFPGIQDRQHAYREGMYLIASQRYLRENIMFDTGLEGHIPTYGDLVVVAHDMPRWGQSGWIVHASQESDTRWLLYLSEPLRWEESGEYVMLLRGRKGESIGPLSVAQSDDAQQVYVEIDDSSSSGFDFLLGGDTEPMLFVFGPLGRVAQDCRITRIEPKGGEQISITCTNVDPTVYSFDELEAPPLGQLALAPKAPDLPTVAQVYLSQVDPSLGVVQVAWTSAFGAQYYIVQTSEDNVYWSQRGTTTRTALQLQANPGPFYVRVSAVNTGQGPWAVANISIKRILGLDVLTDMEDSSFFRVSWLAVFGVSQYQIDIYDLSDSSHPLIKSELLEDTSFTYSFEDMLDDYAAVVRDVRIEVQAAPGGVPDGNPASVDLHNSAPDEIPVLDIGAPVPESSGAQVIYPIDVTYPSGNDIYKLKCWILPGSGWDPNVETPTLEITAESIGPGDMPPTINVPYDLDSDGTHPELSCRVAVFDCWGDEISISNITLEHVIPEYP